MNEAKYREAEGKFWATVGLKPTEQRVKLASTGTDVRVQEVGSGAPVLFIHGGPNAGSTWVPMLEHFDGFRCLLVDRPGTGLSENYEVTKDNLEEFGAAFVGDVLSGLGIEKAHVVGSSFGGHLALRSAAAHPERIDRMVQMACPALVPGDTIPGFMKMIAKGWFRAILNILPPNQRANRSIFRQIGHGYSLDHGLISQSLLDWYLALQKYTDTSRNDGNMIGRAIPHHDLLMLTADLLGKVTTPTLFYWGADDGFGGQAVATNIVKSMPDAELTMLPNSGHLPWLDDPAKAAAATKEFLLR